MNKALLATGVSLLIAGGMTAQETAPAFPGAEGHGRYTQGGRGGKVIHVTNLKDYYDDEKNALYPIEEPIEGSLRWAMKQAGPKTIVFDVGGYIDLKCQLNVTSNTTIAGQTAPGDGITLRYYTLYFGNCDNVIVRFIRSRRSQVKDVNDGADATWGRNRHDIIIDHCSFSWSIDEVASFYDNKNFSLQWCTLGEGLANPGHSKGSHSYGGIWGGKNASFHHNFLAHVQNRAPRFNGARYSWTGYDKTQYSSTVDAERVDFRNCVIYNWGNGNGCYGGPGGGYINIVNNYYKAGPGTKNKTNVTQVSVASSGNADKKHPELYGYASRYYVDGNYVTAASTPENYDWKGITKFDSGLSMINGERYIKDEKHFFGENVEYVKDDEGIDCVSLKLTEGIDAGDITTHTAIGAYEKILEYAGASLNRDATDARYFEEARTGTTTYNGDVAYVDKNGKKYATSNTKGILDFINDPNGVEEPKTASFPALATVKRTEAFDTDGDGMPDEWEKANGLDPNDPEDGALYTIDTEKGWYSNVEVYLNSLVADIMAGGQADGIEGFDEYYPESVKVDLGDSFVAGISNIEAASGIARIEYYSLDGIRLTEPAEGISIRRIVYNDGHIESDKVIK